ncbi:hypothetical protein [Microbacterium paraoxydans]|uniref:hypothetical protein n=1 Tax=Microbacterium paraoxydans TaxID=199592 RepID=UPI003D75DCAB
MSNNSEAHQNEGVRTLRDARLLSLLQAARDAGISPVQSTRFHQLVYLCNALAPVWDVVPLTKELLKLYGTPYDAGLQDDIDRLVAAGLIRARDLHYFQTDQGSWQVGALYALGPATLTDPILRMLWAFPDERESANIAREVCLAVSALPAEWIDRVLSLDVAYADPRFSPNSVISLLDSDGENGSSRAAQLFQDVSDKELTPSEQAGLYIRHLFRIASRVA